ncbi:ABC transporter substrate-binding protein [Kribbella sancticallisti]|uniref:ABC transporter substrate-binding protein n=1 Tax=Kribbella sancticallisti TaxID=460087 RepID=A0ABP4PK15_9ACTN
MLTPTLTRPAVADLDDALQRRQFLAVLAAAGLLTACGTDDEPTSEGAQPWSFTDDRGSVINRPGRPVKIAAYETAGAALYYLGLKPAAIFSSGDMAKSKLLEGVDLTGIESVGGKAYGEIQLEKLAKIAPDIIVTAYSPKQGDPVWGFADKTVQDKVAAIAPVIALDGTKDPTAVIARFEELAKALGADLAAAPVSDAKKTFDGAVEELKSAAAAKKDLRVLAIGGYSEKLYVAKPSEFPALRQMKSWGLNLIEPTGKDPLWETLSFEHADKYPADLILVDTKDDAMTTEQLAKIPTWKRLPAVQAGQLVRWQAIEDWSYTRYTDDITVITQALQKANRTTAA